MIGVFAISEMTVASSVKVGENAPVMDMDNNRVLFLIYLIAFGTILLYRMRNNIRLFLPSGLPHSTHIDTIGKVERHQ